MTLTTDQDIGLLQHIAPIKLLHSSCTVRLVNSLTFEQMLLSLPAAVIGVPLFGLTRH